MANVIRDGARNMSFFRRILSNLGSRSSKKQPSIEAKLPDIVDLPSLKEMIPSLPPSLHTEANSLSTALSEARVAIKTAAAEGSDNEERSESFRTCRQVLDQYKILVSRVGDFDDSSVPSSTMTPPSNASIAQSPDADKDEAASQPATRTEQPTQEPTTAEKPSASDNAESTTRSSRYTPPKAEDAFAEHIVNSPNPVVRIFGPHVESMKYGLFLSSRQRVWIGWTNWF